MFNFNQILLNKLINHDSIINYINHGGQNGAR